ARPAGQLDEHALDAQLGAEAAEVLAPPWPVGLDGQVGLEGAPAGQFSQPLGLRRGEGGGCRHEGDYATPARPSQPRKAEGSGARGTGTRDGPGRAAHAANPSRPRRCAGFPQRASLTPPTGTSIAGVEVAPLPPFKRSAPGRPEEAAMNFVVVKD